MILVNGKKLEPTMFPDGTSQVWKLDIPDFRNVHVYWNFENEAEIIHLLQLSYLFMVRDGYQWLEIDYLPYGRQDKQVSNDSTFALSPFCAIINLMDFKQVVINDPHSELSLWLIKNSRAQYPISKVLRVFTDNKHDVICYPDKGAKEKYTKLYQEPFIYGEKVRDQSSGNILSYNLVGDCKNKNVLIVDDICDGGATFINLTKSLKEQGAKKVDLFVTHGIFSKGTKILRDSGISGIFTKKGEVK